MLTQRFCFPASTLVWVVDPETGELTQKKIEEIKKGDKVLAWDEEAEKVVIRQVTDLYRGETESWIDLKVGAATISPTPFHEVWVESESKWMYAHELSVGMKLRLADCRLVPVESVTFRKLDQGEKTYNLEVKDVHNYFVGSLGVLVHNGLPLDQPGHWNSELQDADGNTYYHGRAGPNQTEKDVERRHSSNGDRFDQSNGDRLKKAPGKRTYGESRVKEHNDIERDGTNKGRDPSSMRANRQRGIAPNKMGKYKGVKGFKPCK